MAPKNKRKEQQGVSLRFNKPPKTFEEQLKLLSNRGMRIDDWGTALH